MIEFTTVEDTRVWIAQERVVMITAALSKQETGPPIVVVGAAMLYLAGMPPIAVKGSPAEVAGRIGAENGRSSLFTA